MQVQVLVAQGAPRQLWSWPIRLIVFLLAATSIGSLLAEFYGICSMRLFTGWVFLPAVGLLAGLVVIDAAQGTSQLAHSVLMGAAAGLLAAITYDVFRLPFVFAKSLGIAQIVPPLNLFKVFVRFGAMMLGEPIEQAHYSGWAQLLGWAYHFSNGVTFGIMYVALVGEASKRHWGWAVLFAVGLEVGMLVTPYPQFFRIPLTANFIVATLAAHALFGVVLGLASRRISRAWVWDRRRAPDRFTC
jgi:hypothetical protein